MSQNQLEQIMTTDVQAPLLSDEQRGRIYGMLTMGCDWETVSRYLGFTTDQLRLVSESDDAFRREIVRCEAASDLHQVRNMHLASRDVKNWRTSVWWLERTSPVRFAKRPGSAITFEEWQKFLEEMAQAVSDEVTLDEDCKRLQKRLLRLTYAPQINHFDGDLSELEEDKE
jgi:hypothetical protein